MTNLIWLRHNSNLTYKFIFAFGRANFLGSSCMSGGFVQGFQIWFSSLGGSHTGLSCGIQVLLLVDLRFDNGIELFLLDRWVGSISEVFVTVGIGFGRACTGFWSTTASICLNWTILCGGIPGRRARPITFRSVSPQTIFSTWAKAALVWPSQLISAMLTPCAWLPLLCSICLIKAAIEFWVWTLALIWLTYLML